MTDAGRALTGLACGAITATVPSYIAELSISSIRGVLTGLFEVTYQTGSLIGFWINYGINQNMDPNSVASWRVPMAVQIIPAGMLLIGGWFLHESPLWLFRKSRDEEAYKALEELRRIPRDHLCESTPCRFSSIMFTIANTLALDLQQEVDQIRTRLAEERLVSSEYGAGSWAFIRGALSELSRKGMRNRVFLVFCAFTLQNMSGAAGLS
jgi:MFS family permease